MNALRQTTLDRRAPSGRSTWIRAKKLEAQYAARLRQIAKHIGDIVRGFDPRSFEGNLWIRVALEKYAQTIEPWARAVGARMVAEVAHSERRAWLSRSVEIGRALHREIETTPIGEIVRQRLADQVTLIKSIPLEAAERVHALTLEGIANGTRASEIAEDIMRQGEVSKSRANLIARTEVGCTSAELTRARALHVGSTHFIWRAVMDADTRPSHRKLNGKAFAWDDPPECDPGHHALPGAIWNCRCWSEPIIPE